MLITKNLQENDVVSMKLSSGEEIIGRYQREDDNSIFVTKPVVLIMNNQGISMAPYMFTVNPDADYCFNKKNVTTQAATDAEISKQYLTQTSGIAMR
jgi:hypothetical protein